jgi:putative ABC transport system permease protein
MTAGPLNSDYGSPSPYRRRNLFKLLKLSYRNLFRNRRRSFFAVFIAASGCAALAIAIGYYSFSMYSLQELSIRNGFGGSSGSGHVQVMDKRMGVRAESYTLEFGLESVSALMANLKNDQDIDYFLPRLEFGGLISNGERSLPFKGFGIEPANEMRLWAGLSEINPKLKLGDQLLPLEAKKAGIILGKTIANALNARLGDMLMIYSTTVDGTINGMDVELLGIMSTGVSETDKYYLLTRLDLAQKLLNSQKVSLLSVMFKNRNHFPEKLKNLQSFLGRDSSGALLTAIPWDQQAAFYISIRDIFTIIFSFMGTIVLVIVLLSCWNIMQMTTMERIREIGTLRAIGLGNKHISALFVLEAFLIAVIGVVIGMVTQWIISGIINAMRIIMPPVPGMSRPYTLQVYAATWFHPLIALGIIAAITISSFSSILIIKRYSIVGSLEHT